MDGGVDLIFIEIIFDVLNVRVVFMGVKFVFLKRGKNLLVIIFGIIVDKSGRILLG